MDDMFYAIQKFRVNEFRSITNNIIKIQFYNRAWFNAIHYTNISEIRD